MADQWRVMRGVEQFGPYGWDDLVRFARGGQIAPTDLIWSDASGAWQPASGYAALFPATPSQGAAPEPPVPGQPAASPPQAGKRGRRWLLVGAALALLALGATALWIWRAGGLPSGDGGARASETVALTVESTPWQDPPGRLVPLATGGALFVPDGSLAPDVTISAAIAPVPLLPEGYDAIGPVYDITLSAQPEGPVTVRLPIPQGEVNAEGLVILRVLDIGYAECLETHVSGGELVAYTSAFSRFTVTRPRGARPVNLAGPPELVPGERGTFFAVRDAALSPPGSRLRALWDFSGPLTVISESDDGAVVRAGAEPGDGFVEYYCTDAAQGMRWYGALPLRVVAASERLAGGFVVSAVAQAALVNPGEAVNVSAELHGDYTPPIQWEWSTGGSAPGGRTTTGVDVSQLNLPPLYYEARFEPVRVVTVRATDAQGRTATGECGFLVMPDALQVRLEGPNLLIFQGEPLLEAYTATATAGRTRYRWSWSILPGLDDAGGSDKPDPHDGRYVRFGEPGGYRVRATVEDESGATASATMEVTVVPLEWLSTRLLDLPATARPGQEIGLHVQVRGGVLVSGGRKGGYTLEIDWGDGSGLPARNGLGADRTPDQGFALETSHAWQEPGPRRVIVNAWDATGATAQAVGEILITEDAVAVATVPAGENTPPVAEDILTSAERGSDVAITLHGRDDDGDDLTYTIVSGPGQGTLTGEPPFLTYAPKTELTGGKDTFTYTVSDGQATSAPATVTIEIGTRWVLQGGPVINRWEARREFEGGTADPEYFGEERFAGMFTRYSVDAGSITWADRSVDHGYEAHNISIQCAFDAPPPVLYAGDAIPLEVRFSHSGSVTEGNPGLRFQFFAGTPLGDDPLAWEDWQQRRIVDPAGPAAYFPWEAGFSGVNEATWTLQVPEGRVGDALAIQAGLWNCAPCNVTWVYRAE